MDLDIELMLQLPEEKRNESPLQTSEWDFNIFIPNLYYISMTKNYQTQLDSRSQMPIFYQYNNIKTGKYTYLPIILLLLLPLLFFPL